MIKVKRLIGAILAVAVLATSTSHCEGGARSNLRDCFASLAMTKLAPESRFNGSTEPAINKSRLVPLLIEAGVPSANAEKVTEDEAQQVLGIISGDESTSQKQKQILRILSKYSIGKKNALELVRPARRVATSRQSQPNGAAVTAASAAMRAEIINGWTRTWEAIIEKGADLSSYLTSRSSYPFVSKWLHRFVNQDASASILDLGSGPRISADDVRRKFPQARAYSLDIAKIRGPLSKHVRGDAIELPYKDKAFDIVIAGAILDYVDKEKAMSELSRVTADSGKAILILDHPDYTERRLADLDETRQICEIFELYEKLLVGQIDLAGFTRAANLFLINPHSEDVTGLVSDLLENAIEICLRKEARILSGQELESEIARALKVHKEWDEELQLRIVSQKIRSGYFTSEAEIEEFLLRHGFKPLEITALRKGGQTPHWMVACEKIQQGESEATGQRVPTRDELKRHYAKMIELRGIKEAANGDIMIYGLASNMPCIQNQIVERLALYGTGQRILSVGMGPGLLEKALKERGLSITGIDIVEEALAIARRYGINALERDAHDTGFPAGSFDTILFSESIGCLDAERALKEAARILNGEGRVILSTYITKPDDKDVFEKTLYRKFNKEEILEAFRKAGFEAAVPEVISAPDGTPLLWLFTASPLAAFDNRRAIASQP